MPNSGITLKRPRLKAPMFEFCARMPPRLVTGAVPGAVTIVLPSMVTCCVSPPNATLASRSMLQQLP